MFYELERGFVAMTRFLLLFIILIVAAIKAQENDAKYNEAATAGGKKIRGEQYVRQTMVAKILGGPIPKNVLDLLEGNITAAKIPKAEDNKKPPILITDTVKTVVTRVAIPLSLRFMDSEWYRSTLKKFLSRNKITISKSDLIESPDDTEPSADSIYIKLRATIQLRSNMIYIFEEFLQITGSLLPKDYHPALSLILYHLKLRRIPVIGILEGLEQIADKRGPEIFQLIFTELWEVVPKYILSSVTLWLEGLQDESVINNNIITAYSTPEALFAEIPLYEGNMLVQKPLLFSRNTVIGLQKDHDMILGKTMAAILSAVSRGSMFMNAQLFTLLFLNLPLNVPSSFDAVWESYLNISESEIEAFRMATVSLRHNFYKLPLLDIFTTILQKITKIPYFEGKQKYDEFLKSLQAPTEDFIYNSIK